MCWTWSSTAQTISVWHQSTAKTIQKHAEPSLYIDQWEPTVLWSSHGALMSYNDRSACAVLLHYMTSYTFQAGTRKQNHDGGRGSNLFQNSFCTFRFEVTLHTAGKIWLNMTYDGMQSNIALYFISESIFSTHFVEHLTIIFMCKFRVFVLESFMVQGTLNIHCVCVCSWNKSSERCDDALFLLIWLIIYSLF